MILALTPTTAGGRQHSDEKGSTQLEDGHWPHYRGREFCPNDEQWFIDAQEALLLVHLEKGYYHGSKYRIKTRMGQDFFHDST